MYRYIREEEEYLKIQTRNLEAELRREKEKLEEREMFAGYLAQEFRAAERVFNRHCPLDIQVVCVRYTYSGNIR